MFPFISQVAGGGSDINFTQLFTQLGFSAIFFWMWWNERKERMAVQATLNEFLEKFGSLIPEAAQTLSEVKRGMDVTVDRTLAPMRKLEQIVDELDSATRRRRNES